MKDALNRFRTWALTAVSVGLELTSQLVAGHRASLALLADTDAVQQTLDTYERALGVPVYLRVTGSGLTVMSLDVERCRSMISVGTRGRRDDLLSVVPPHEGLVRSAVAGYEAKRDGLARGSVEERFALGHIAAALRSGLELPAPAGGSCIRSGGYAFRKGRARSICSRSTRSVASWS